MNTYYVSNQGLDTNDGLSPETAWQTIPKVNESMKGGDVVKFRCGDTFYGQIIPKPGESLDKMTTITSYGEGKKPIISQYKIINSDAWEKVSDGIYRVDLMDVSKYTGNIYNIDNNTGFILVSGKVQPFKKAALGELCDQWDFYNDKEDGHLYVKSDKNPAEYSDDIRVACRIAAIPFRNYMKLEGLFITGTGAHGTNGCTLGAHIKDCDYHNIGGSELPGYPRPNTRYGNGVECWTGCHDVLIEGCTFSGIYDVAFTMQGPAKGQSWENVVVRNCRMFDNTQSFEIWVKDGEEGTGFKNCRFENNVCINAGYSWGYISRPDPQKSCHLLMYGLNAPIFDITITGNLFCGSRPSMIYSGGPQRVPEGYKIIGNTFVCDKGEDLAHRSGCSDEVYDKFYKRIESCNIIMTRERN